MSEQNAAQVDESNLDDNLDQEVVETNTEAQPTESAPVATEQDPQDVIQERINKQVARTYKEKRRADDLQRQLNEVNANKVVTPKAAPKLEDYDHDEDLYNAANIQYQVGEAVKVESDRIQQNAANARQQQSNSEFEGRIATLGKADFDEVANSVPMLPNGVADALMQSEQGPELIYHLGTHLDVADKLAGMTSQAAMMELGRISSSMNAAPKPKTSAAPDPIETLNTGGSISNKDEGPPGATYE